MAKCEICTKKIESTFLEKIIGTYVKDMKGKKHAVCHSCQKKLKSKSSILENLK